MPSRCNEGEGEKYRGARIVGLGSHRRRVLNNDRDKEPVALSALWVAEESYALFPEVTEWGQAIVVAHSCVLGL